MCAFRVELAGVALDLGRFYKTKWLKEPARGENSDSATKNAPQGAFFRVELAGVEPASKQGNHTLSTRLFQPSVFVQRQDLDHQPLPYPLNLIMQPRHCLTIPDFAAPLNQRASGRRLLSDVSFHHLVTELSQ